MPGRNCLAESPFVAPRCSRCSRRRSRSRPASAKVSWERPCACRRSARVCPLGWGLRGRSQKCRLHPIRPVSTRTSTQRRLRDGRWLELAAARRSELRHREGPRRLRLHRRPAHVVRGGTAEPRIDPEHADCARIFGERRRAERCHRVDGNVPAHEQCDDWLRALQHGGSQLCIHPQSDGGVVPLTLRRRARRRAVSSGCGRLAGVA